MHIDFPTHILHCNLKFLPTPTVLASVHLSHDILQLYQTRFGFVAEVVLGNLMPVLLWHLAFDTTSSNFLEPVVYGHVPLGISVEHGRVLPSFVDWAKIELFDLESFEHLFSFQMTSEGDRKGARETTIVA